MPNSKSVLVSLLNSKFFATIRLQGFCASKHTGIFTAKSTRLSPYSCEFLFLTRFFSPPHLDKVDCATRISATPLVPNTDACHAALRTKYLRNVLRSQPAKRAILLMLNPGDFIECIMQTSYRFFICSGASFDSQSNTASP